MNNKICPPGKILNPKTNRCVNIDGAIGKQILQTSQLQPEPEPQPELQQQDPQQLQPQLQLQPEPQPEPQQQESPQLKNVLNDIDIGSIIKKNLQLADALSLYNSKKHKDFITVEKVPKVFIPFWHYKKSSARWILSITKPSFIITFGVKLGTNKNKSPKLFKYLMVLVKYGKIYDRLYIDLITKKTYFAEFYADQSDIENGKKRVQELVKDIFTKIESSESANIINLSMIKPMIEFSYKYMIPDEFALRSPPLDIKLKFNKSECSYYYNSGGVKAEMDFSGYKISINNEIRSLNVMIKLTIPKKKTYIKADEYYGEIRNNDEGEFYNPYNNNITKAELTLYWSQAYDVFTTFLSNLTLDTKKMILKTCFEEYTNNEDELFANINIIKYPAFFYS